jgi:hypothetical protein
MQNNVKFVDTLPLLPEDVDIVLLRPCNSSAQCVVYENFDYREGVKHQLISNHVEMRSVTTGKVFRGADIPLGGLKKSMLHCEVPLTIEDLLYSPGAAVYDETATKIDTYFIAEAI